MFCIRSLFYTKMKECHRDTKYRFSLKHSNEHIKSSVGMGHRMKVGTDSPDLYFQPCLTRTKGLPYSWLLCLNSVFIQGMRCCPQSICFKHSIEYNH